MMPVLSSEFLAEKNSMTLLPASVTSNQPKKAKKGGVRFSEDGGGNSDEGYQSGSKAASRRLFTMESLSRRAESVSTGLFGRSQQAIKRRVKSYSANIATLRAAVVVMFPPTRRKILRSMRDFMQARQLSKITR